MASYSAKDIETLEGLDPVRKRPGMYIGSTSVKGLNHLVYEILDNSVDEHLAGYCDEIHVTINKDGTATVEDNGRGIPVDMHAKGVPAVRVILTTLHAGGKFDSGAYKVSGGLHGVGSSAVNALSEYLEVEVFRDGKIHYDRYEQGVPVAELVDGLLPVTGKTRKKGTKITFKPDATIFDTVKFKVSSIKRRLHETAYLNPNLTIHFTNARDDEETIVYHEPDGLKGFVQDLITEFEPLTEIVYIHDNRDGMELEAAFAYTGEPGDNVLGFCNNIHTAEGGTHLQGFKTGFTKIINQYARELGVLKDKDVNYTGNDTRNGMTCVIAVKHPEPRFEGQTKTKLDNQDALKASEAMVVEKAQLYFDRNLEQLKTVIDCAQKAANRRKNEEKAKINLNDKKFAFEGNGKLARQESNDPKECEIFIVEGDSAGGSAKMARDRRTQAIMPIRGKILNVEKQSLNKVLENAEIQSMIIAFGTGIQDDFDISKLKYDKIVIMTDADVDGAHISTLLLTFFYRFMPELIYQGHVYIAMPPLYRAEHNGKFTYLYNDRELEDFKKKHKGTIGLQRYKGLGEMDASQLWETTLDPSVRKMKRVEIEDSITANQITSMLMGSEVPPRRAFIEQNAVYATVDL